MKIRSAKAGGCNDWFVPSISEIEKLRKAVESRAVSGGKIAGRSYKTSVFNHTWLCSSSEFLSQRARYWYYARQRWDGGNKGLDFSVILTRAF